MQGKPQNKTPRSRMYLSFGLRGVFPIPKKF